MTALTQSGYPVIDRYGAPALNVRASVGGCEFPGGIRAGSVTTVLLYVAHRWDTEVEPLDPSQCWGYAHRDIRGGTGWSNHAGGCAIDLNAVKHPQHTRTLSAGKIKTAHKILKAVKSAVRWGGDWTPASLDQMHWEIKPGAAGTKTDKLAARIRSGKLPNTPTHLLGAGVKPKKKADPKPSTAKTRGGVTADGVSVEELQRALNEHGAHLAVDGIWGPLTSAAVGVFQKDHGLVVDHYAGPKTWTALQDTSYTSPPDGGRWPLPGGEFFGLITGPARSHGGYNAWERKYVKWIQVRLHELGYAPGGAWADGKYEQPTVDAVAAWQHARHAATTSRPGEVWADDWKNLQKDR